MGGGIRGRRRKEGNCIKVTNRQAHYRQDLTAEYQWSQSGEASVIATNRLLVKIHQEHWGRAAARVRKMG